MKKVFFILLTVLISLSFKKSQNISSNEDKSDEILVQFRDFDDTVSIRQFGGKFKSKITTKSMERFNQKGFIVLKVPNKSRAITALQNNPNVKWVSDNYKVELVQSYPNDPYYTNGGLWAMNSIKANTVWQTNKGSQNVFVGIIDEGILYNHQDLCGQIWNNPYDLPDGRDNDNNGYIDDIHGWDFFNDDSSIYDGVDNHGTHVAGTIGGIGNNGIGVVGVSPNVTMISAKFLQNGGYLDDAIRAIDYLTDLKLRHGINIVASSNSWGGGGYSQGLYDAIERAKMADILFVAAAGNASNNNDLYPSYPASYVNDNIISVAAINSSDGIASFSNYGARSVDIAAPGVGIVSSVGTSVSSYAYYDGTSMATPHVTGAVALYKAANPTTTYSQIKNAILSNARPVASMQGKCLTNGTLNISSFTTPVNEVPIVRNCSNVVVDNQPPTIPTNLQVTNKTNISLSLGWNASTDNIAVAGYKVYYKVTSSNTYIPIVSTTNSVTIGGLLPNTKYNVYVQAYDNSNNLSQATSVITDSTLSDQLNLSASLFGSLVNKRIHSLSWRVTTNGTINRVIIQTKKPTDTVWYNLYFTTTTVGKKSYSRSGTHLYRVFASITQNSRSTYSNTVTLTSQ